MYWQQIVVAVLVVLAAGYVLQRGWRTWFGKGKSGCGGSCGCGKQEPALPHAKTPLISEEQLLGRLRHRT